MMIKELVDRKKDKEGIKQLRQWLKGAKDFDEITIAKFLSSFMTHILIEIEGQCETTDEVCNMAQELELVTISSMVHNIISGQTSTEVVREILKRKLEYDS